MNYLAAIWNDLSERVKLYMIWINLLSVNIKSLLKWILWWNQELFWKEKKNCFEWIIWWNCEFFWNGFSAFLINSAGWKNLFEYIIMNFLANILMTLKTCDNMYSLKYKIIWIQLSHKIKKSLEWIHCLHYKLLQYLSEHPDNNSWRL